MEKGEIKLEIQQKTESPQIEQEGVKQEKVKRDEVKIMHAVEQNKAFFKRKSEENVMNKGCPKKVLSAKINKKSYVILFLIKKLNNVMCILEKEVLMRYVDTYSR